MDVHAIKRLIEVKGHELWLGVGEIFAMVHPIISLVLIPIQIAHGPLDLKSETLPLQIILMLV